MVEEGLAQIVSKSLVFKGAKDNPLLAPRGVYLVNNMLLVADTAQNRLFIWRNLPDTEFADPDIVLGQQKKENTGRNAQGGVNASSLFYPSGIWSDGRKIILADAWNHRVLIWNEIPDKDGTPADVVIGQPDFNGNDPNVQGISSPPSSRSLNWPYGVYSDGKQLWIADTGNRRILYYKNIPIENFVAADKVLGKENFEQRDYEHTDPIWPYSVKIGPRGEMAIADTQYYRTLIWNNWKDAENKKADAIIGQKDLDGNGQNQFGWFPAANTLNWTYDTCFYREGIWVADTGNSRLLWFEKIPKENDKSADNLIGQKAFNIGSENKDTIWNTEGSLYWPFQICVQDQIMVIADTGNHRIVIKTLNL